MRIINTAEITPGEIASDAERLWVYNGLDACVTAEVLDVLLPQLDNLTGSTYSFSKSLQGPCLEMRLRGVRIDMHRRREVVEEFQEKLDFLETNLERIVREGLDFYGFNWRSTAHLREVFYDKLGIPVIRRQGRPTVNRDALEKLETYVIARPIVRHLETMRDLVKKIQVLETEIDPDGRIRTSYNIGGTSTGRLSSSFSEFGTGTNLQNIEESLRSIFIADNGMKMAYFDGEQIQSRIVGAIEWNLFKDGRYLDACETGNLHTAVARMVWPKELPWTGDLARDTKIAETPYYRHYTYRFMCKKLGHGSNFDGKPPEISRQTHIHVDEIEDFQTEYFRAFPAHRGWREWTAAQLLRYGWVVALTGRQRHFWGRRDDPATVREALAYDAQASESHIVNTGMLRVWRERDGVLLFQDHDAVTVQYPEEREDEIIPKVLAQLRVPVELKHGRELVVPFGCKTGWNKGEYHVETNPDGLKAYAPGDKRTRSKEVRILDRIVRGVYGKSG
jgi:DNA polymerase-1